MNIIIASKSEQPIYEQLYEQLVAQIVNGKLPVGFCLPSIRALARELSISIITVKKAYEMLEEGKFIYTQAGKGCFVADIPQKLNNRKIDIAAEQLQKDLAFYKGLQLNQKELLGLIKKLYK